MNLTDGQLALIIWTGVISAFLGFFGLFGVLVAEDDGTGLSTYIAKRICWALLSYPVILLTTTMIKCMLLIILE